MYSTYLHGAAQAQQATARVFWSLNSEGTSHASLVQTKFYRALHRSLNCMVSFPTQIVRSWKTDLLCFLIQPLSQWYTQRKCSNLPKGSFNPCYLPLQSSRSSPEVISLTALPTMAAKASPPVISGSSLYFASSR